MSYGHKIYLGSMETVIRIVCFGLGMNGGFAECKYAVLPAGPALSVAPSGLYVSLSEG
jgi:hypothetical protein